MPRYNKHDKQTIEEKNNVIFEITEKVDTTLDTVKAVMLCYVMEPGMLIEITAALDTLKKEVSEFEIQENDFDTALEIIKDLDEADINLGTLFDTLPHDKQDILEAIDIDEITTFVDSLENHFLIKSKNLMEVCKIEDFIRDELIYNEKL